jgi:uncharacterized protein (TIGR03545 family)
MMRKKFLWFVLIPIVIISLVVYLFLDRWVESGLESMGEEIVGARVEIDDLSLTLFPLGIEFHRLQVANPENPWKNLAETGQVRFLLDPGQLLRNKYIIETMEVNELILGTRRTTDGSLPPRTREEEASPSFLRQAATAVASRVEQAPVFDLASLKRTLNIDSLINLNISSFKSIQHIDTLKVRVQNVSREWEVTLTEIEGSRQRIAEIEASVKAIDINELKTIEAITGAVNNLNTVTTNIQELNKAYTTRRASITNQVGDMTTAIDAIDDLAKEDYERVRSLARLPDLSMQGLATLLLGKTLLQEVEYYLGWMDRARNTIRAYMPKPEYENPKRLEGQDVPFPVDRSYPKFWVKNIQISGGTDRNQDTAYFYIAGEAKNISDNQRLTGQPLTVGLSARKGESLSGRFEATFDRRMDLPVDDYAASVTGIPIASFSLGSSDFLPATITQSAATLSAGAHIPGSQFDAHVNMVFGGVVLQFERPARNDVERLTRRVLEGVHGFTADVRVWNTEGSFDLAFSTDLDNMLAAGVMRVMGEEFTRIQNEIRAKVDRTIAEYRAGLDRLFRQKKDEALERLASYERLLNEKIALVETKKKELEARVEEEKRKQTDAAKKKLEDAVKGLFNKQ